MSAIHPASSLILAHTNRTLLTPFGNSFIPANRLSRNPQQKIRRLVVWYRLGFFSSYAGSIRVGP